MILNIENFKTKNGCERLKMLKDLLCAFDSSLNKGYVTNHDLSKHPLISELFPSFLKENDEGYISGLESKESFK
jgi:hypothetical protein